MVSHICHLNGCVFLSINSVLETMTDMCFSPWLSSRTIRQLFGKEKRYADSKSRIRGFIRKVKPADLLQLTTVYSFEFCFS